MKSNEPKKIYRQKPYLLACEFADGFKAVIKLESFRKGCPCAECTSKENKQEKSFGIPLLNTLKPGMYELKSLRKVGNYAVAAVWGDEHDTGIYTWDNLRDIFEDFALDDNQINELEKKFG